MGKRSVYSLLKTGGRLDIAVFALTVLLAVVTVFSLWFFLRSQPPAESAEELMAAGIMNFIFVVIAMVESCVLAALLALGCVGLASGIRALRAAKREDARVCGNSRAFPVFTLIHLVICLYADPSCHFCRYWRAVLYSRVGMVYAAAFAPLHGGGVRVSGGVFRGQVGLSGKAEKGGFGSLRSNPELLKKARRIG